MLSFEASLPLHFVSLVSEVGLFPTKREVHHVADSLSFTVYAGLGYRWTIFFLEYLTVARLPFPVSDQCLVGAL